MGHVKNGEKIAIIAIWSILFCLHEGETKKEKQTCSYGPQADTSVNERQPAALILLNYAISKKATVCAQNFDDFLSRLGFLDRNSWHAQSVMSCKLKEDI